MAKRNFPEKKKKSFEIPVVDVAESTGTLMNPSVEMLEQYEELGKAPVFGVVSGCKLLNIRAKPHISGVVVGIQSEGCRLAVDEEKSTKDWYYVSDGIIDGYCMRKYISLLK